MPPEPLAEQALDNGVHVVVGSPLLLGLGGFLALDGLVLDLRRLGDALIEPLIDPQGLPASQ